MTKQLFRSGILLLFVSLLSSSVDAQKFHYYGSKNDEGKYALLARNLSSKITDTLTPYKYHYASVIGDYFLLVDHKFGYNDEKGKLYGHYYHGDIVDKNFEVIKHFDTISTTRLTWASTISFKFFKNGKVGYYSDALSNRKWTDLYDEITLTKEVKLSGFKHRQPAYVARSGTSTVLLSPRGIEIAKLETEDQADVWKFDLIKIDRKSTQSWDLMDIEGNLLTKDVVSEQKCLDSKLNILTHSDGKQSLWNGSTQVVPPVPYSFSTAISGKSKSFLVQGKDDSFYYISRDASVLAGPYDGLIKLSGIDNSLIKENGKWRLEGPKVEAYKDRRFTEVNTLKEEGNGAVHVLTSGVDVLVVDIRGRKIRFGETSNAAIHLQKTVVVAEKDKKWARLTDEGFSDFIYEELELPSGYNDYMIGKIGKSAVLVDVKGNPLFQENKLIEIQYHNCELGENYELKGREFTAYFSTGGDLSKVSFIYDDFECADYGYCLKKDGKWGLVSYDGKIIEEFKHKKLGAIQTLEPE